MIPDERVNSFHEGQVWKSPKGTLYRVTFTNHQQAALRLGSNGAGRVVRRPWDAVVNWALMFDPVYPEHKRAVQNGQ